MARSSRDLPAPLGPRMKRISCGWRSKLTSDTMGGRSPKKTVRWDTLRGGNCSALPSSCDRRNIAVPAVRHARRDRGRYCGHGGHAKHGSFLKSRGWQLARPTYVCVGTDAREAAYRCPDRAYKELRAHGAACARRSAGRPDFEECEWSWWSHPQPLGPRERKLSPNKPLQPSLTPSGLIV